MLPPKKVVITNDKKAEQNLHWLMEDIYRKLGKHTETIQQVTQQITQTITGGGGGAQQVITEPETPQAPPSKVINVAIADEINYIDPITNVTMAQVTVSWDDNPDVDNVDLYEIVWTE